MGFNPFFQSLPTIYFCENVKTAPKFISHVQKISDYHKLVVKTLPNRNLKFSTLWQEQSVR